jgi:Xaa-Pro aminopeptidase
MVEAFAIPREEYEERRESTQQALRAKGLDGLIAFSCYAEREGHVCYLTNHHLSFPNVMSHMGLGHAALVLPAEGLGVLISPFGYEADKVVGIDDARTGMDLAREVVAAVKGKGLDQGRIGMVGTDVVPAEYYNAVHRGLSKASFESADDLLESQRLIKSEKELELLRQAAWIADAGLQAGMAAAQASAREYDVELAARRAVLEAGADFVPRVRVSSGAKIPDLRWPQVGDRQLQKGDFVYLDLIGWYANYGFDNSRVTVVGGATGAQVDYLEHMVEATEWMIGALQPGRPARFVYTESRDRTITPFGHGIGLEIGENPWLTMGREFAPKPNMVLCIEPFLEAEEYGGMAIEDTVVITATGTEVLNRCPRVFW